MQLASPVSAHNRSLVPPRTCLIPCASLASRAICAMAKSLTTAFANWGLLPIGIREGLLRRRLHQRSGTDLLKIAVDDAVALRNASRDCDEAAVGGAE